MPPETAAVEQDLRHYLRVLRRRKWTITLVTLVVVAAALGATALQTPVYEARAQVLLRPTAQEQVAAQAQNRQVNTRAIPTEVQLLQSQAVRDRVIAELGEAPEVRVGQVADTEFIEIRAEHTDPETAATIANTYAEEFIDYRREQAVGGLLALSERVQQEIDQAQQRVDELNLALLDAGSTLTPDEQQMAAERDSLLRTIVGHQDTLSQLRADAEVSSGSAQLVTPATAATDPVRPQPLRTGVLALIVGLCLALGLAYLVDYLDDTVKSKEDVERHSSGVPVLGIIPVVSGWKDRNRTVLASWDQPNSAAAEAYRSARTSIRFLSLERTIRTLLVTSPSAGEGKTTTVANLAVALAMAGQRVIVIDCDLRRPRVHDFFGLSNEMGFTSVVLGEQSLSDAVQPVDKVPGLHVLASGPLPPNPSELLSGNRTEEVLTGLRGYFDVAVIDCPPVLPVTDAAAIATQVDAALMVVRARGTTHKALERAVELLAHVDTPLIGALLNGASEEAAYGYGDGGGYSYRYGHHENGSRRRKGTLSAKS